jgi:tetratricopeptide (TPR) repeat protein
VSYESLHSEWVNKEICKCQELLRNGEITQFAPYIVDGTPLNDVPDWISQTCCYNLKPSMSVWHIISDIKKKLAVRQMELSMEYRVEENTFIGRLQQIALFQSKYYSPVPKNTMIVSGRKGVGRRKFIREIVKNELQNKGAMFADVPLDSKHSIEDYIVLLNQQVSLYNAKSLENLLKQGMDEKVQCAVALTAEVSKYKDYVRILDHIGIVRQNRKLADWFCDVINNESFPNHIVLFVASDYKPDPYVEANYSNVLHVNMPALSRQEAVALFYKYAMGFHVEDDISSADVNYFVDNLNVSPRLLLQAVKAIKDNGLRDAKRHINTLVEEGEKTVNSMIQNVVSEPDMKDLIVLLSQYEFLSEGVLNDIFNDRRDQYEVNIDILTTQSLIDSFGPGNEYIKLDNAIADYVRRARWKLSSDIVDHVETVILEHIDEDGTITGDVSMYLYNVKKQLLAGNVTDQTLLMPSIAIKAIISLYDCRKLNKVIELSDKILSESYHTRIYPEAIREIKYWLCLALCRIGNERVKSEIISANFEKYDQEFLNGFWCRNIGRYDEAVMHYKKSLDYAPNVNKVKRELVMSLLALRKYDDALELAKDNYMNGPENPYHIHAYFRCLVKQRNNSKENKEILLELMKKMQNLDHRKAASFYDSMQLEYKFRIGIQSSQLSSVIADANHLKQKWPDDNDVLRTVNEIYAAQHIEELKTFPEDI